MQLVFDESQKECNNEIWIDVYDISRLLVRNRSEVVKDPETKEYSRVYAIREPEAAKAPASSAPWLLKTIWSTSEKTVLDVQIPLLCEMKYLFWSTQ